MFQKFVCVLLYGYNNCCNLKKTVFNNFYANKKNKKFYSTNIDKAVKKLENYYCF